MLVLPAYGARVVGGSLGMGCLSVCPCVANLRLSVCLSVCPCCSLDAALFTALPTMAMIAQSLCS